MIRPNSHSSVHVWYAKLACIFFLPCFEASKLANDISGCTCPKPGCVAWVAQKAVLPADADPVHSSRRRSFENHFAAGDGLQSRYAKRMALGCLISPDKTAALFFAYLLLGFALFSIVATLFFRRRRARIRNRCEELRAKCELEVRKSHDILLQEIQGLVLRFEAVARHMPADYPLRVMMDTVLERADRVVLDGHDRIRNMQVVTDSEFELSKALATFAGDLSSDGAISFRLVVEGAERTLEPNVRECFYLIGKEAITNAFRHAKASHIEVEVNLGDEWLRLRVRDDGVGIDSHIVEDESAPDHHGLVAMRERTLQIGAELAVWGRDGLGTEVELMVRAVFAYEAGRKSFRSKLRRLIDGGRYK